MTYREIIFAGILGCFVELDYNTELYSIRFLKGKERLKETKTKIASIELDEYFKGKRKDFSCEMDISRLPAFSRKVLNETRKIKYGTTITYSELADRIGSRAVRAVGGALSNNPFPVLIPCHRVVAKSGIGGYSSGVDIKTRLLEFEKNRPITF